MGISRRVSSIVDAPSIAQSWCCAFTQTQARFRIRKLIRILGQHRGIKRVLQAISTNRLTGFECRRETREYQSSSSREIRACLRACVCVSCSRIRHVCISVRSRSR